VFQTLARDDNVSALVGQRQRVDVGPNHVVEAVVAGDTRPRGGEVDAYVDVSLALEMGMQEPTTTGHVNEYRTFAWGRRYQLGTVLREPTERHEGATRIPPLVSKIVILLWVVACSDVHCEHFGTVG
jgi:hypothetical protein